MPRVPRLLFFIVLCAATLLAHHTGARALDALTAHGEEAAPDIPGVTYPRSAPPDLLAGRALGQQEEEREPSNASLLGAVVDVVAEERSPATREPTLRIEIDLAKRRLIVSEDGLVRHAWTIATRRSDVAAATGTYRPWWAAQAWSARGKSLVPMPYAIFFDGDLAIHGASAAALAERASDTGAVRLPLAQAHALYDLVQQHGLDATEIDVTGAAKVARTASRRGKSGPDKRLAVPEKVSASGTASWTLF